MGDRLWGVSLEFPDLPGGTPEEAVATFLDILVKGRVYEQQLLRYNVRDDCGEEFAVDYARPRSGFVDLMPSDILAVARDAILKCDAASRAALADMMREADFPEEDSRMVADPSAVTEAREKVAERARAAYGFGEEERPYAFGPWNHEGPRVSCRYRWQGGGWDGTFRAWFHEGSAELDYCDTEYWG